LSGKAAQLSATNGRPEITIFTVEQKNAQAIRFQSVFDFSGDLAENRVQPIRSDAFDLPS
jgi:hypothetical protein